jgi:hypothetical protein
MTDQRKDLIFGSAEATAAKPFQEQIASMPVKIADKTI